MAANQSLFLAGSMDAKAPLKAKRVNRICANFDIPILWIQDVPGVIPTIENEHNRLNINVLEHSVSRHGHRAGKVSLTIRKGIGHAYFEMNAGNPEAYTVAWPSAEIAFIGPEPGVRIAYRREMEASPNPKAFLVEKANEARKDLEPWGGAHLAYLDDVIDPMDTRPVLIRAFEAARIRRAARPLRSAHR
jgi:acetyl-CoA carboxylase carboxyltransferase component